MKKPVLTLAWLVSEAIRLKHEQETTFANACFMVVTQNNCWQRYKEVLNATTTLLQKKPELLEVISPARTEYELPPLPAKLTFYTSASASADALAKIEEKARVIEVPSHRSRMFG
ncbi:MAG: hypothetical protein Q7R72_03160 [bacterium]|nr:hypothetical protein [bacterium]